MDVQYQKGKMQITHPTGVVTIYDKAEVLLQRKRIEIDIADAQDELKYFDSVLNQMDVSMPKESLLKRIVKVIKQRK